MNRSMLLQRIVRFKDDIASGEIASAGAMKKACKVIVLRIEQIIPDDSVLLQEWREKLQIIRHVKKTFVKEPEKSAAFEYLVDQMATREGISNSLAAKIKRGVKDNMKLFHPAGGENMSNTRSSQQQQQQQQRSKGPRNGCFHCGGPHYANRCPQGQGFFGHPPFQPGPAPPMPSPFMGRGGRGRGRSGGRGRW